MIRSTKHYFNECNKNKKDTISIFLIEYKNMVQKYINILWNDLNYEIPTYLDSEICNKIVSKWNIIYCSKSRVNIETELTATLRQCAAAQAIAIIKAALEKQRKRLWKLAELQRERKNTKKLQKKIDKCKITKPHLKNINAVLDSRFIDFKETPDGFFNMFIKISRLDKKTEIKIPIKHTKISNKWMSKGKLRPSISLNKKYVTLFYEVEKTPLKTEGIKVGADQGLITALTLSDKQVTPKDKDGYDLNSICEKLSRRKKGSKNFKQTQDQRKYYINWSLKQINWSGIKEVRLERIHQIRFGKNTSRKLKSWTYPLIKNKLINLGEVEGFKVTEVDNKLKSQRCSECGWVHRSSRKGKVFKCVNAICGNETDADLNSSFNNEIDLPDVVGEWLKHTNRTTGFFWLMDGLYNKNKERIVPCARKEEIQPYNQLGIPL